MGKRRTSIAAVALLMLAACTFPPLETPPTPRPTPSPAPTPSPPPTATPEPSATPSPSPAPIVPDFDAGEIVVPTIDGLRVRSLAGVDRPTIAGLLPVGFSLRVVMGPVPVDGLGWYLVEDVDARIPDFVEGWVAAGFDPDPLLASTGVVDPEAPFVGSLSGGGDAEQGPIEIGEGDHAIRWVAVDPERRRCAFAVSMATVGGGEPVPAIRATIGTGVDRGTLQPQSFEALGVRGPVFVSVVSDCDWALAIQRVEPVPSPSASP